MNQNIKNETTDLDLSMKENLKFQTLVHNVNYFTRTLGLKSITSFELEFSLKNTATDYTSINILNKILMKKALFKENLVINTPELKKAFDTLLFKKINFFYKIYIRTINQNINLTNGIIQNFNFGCSNFYNSEIILDDLKKMMIVEYFNSIEGRNPLFKRDYNYNIINITTINGVGSNEPKLQKLNKDSNENDLGNDSENNDNFENDHEQEIDNEENEIDDDETKVNTIIGSNAEANFQMNMNEENDFNNSIKFENFSLKEKLETLYFFFNYCFEFSGRRHIFKSEVIDNCNTIYQNKIENLNKQLKNNVVIAKNFDIFIPKSMTIFQPNSILTRKKAQIIINETNELNDKVNKVLGIDHLGFIYTSPIINKSCVIYKEIGEKTKFDQNSCTVKCICKNFVELEELLKSLEIEKSKQTSEISEFSANLEAIKICIKNDNNLIQGDINKKSKRKVTNSKKPNDIVSPEIEEKSKILEYMNLGLINLNNLINNIKDNLLTFKYFDDEDKKKENNYLRMSLIPKNSNLSREYCIYNSTHITTRRQLNKLTENKGTDEPVFKKEKDEEKEKIDRQNKDRAERLVNRNRYNNLDLYEQFSDTTSKYKNKTRKASNKFRIMLGDDNKNDKESNNSDSYVEKSESEMSWKKDDTLSSSSLENKPNNKDYKKNVKHSNREKIKHQKNENKYDNKYDNNDLDDELEGNQNAIYSDESEVIMDCDLILRPSMCQIEIVGNWCMSNDLSSDKLSYLLIKQPNNMKLMIDKSKITYNDKNQLDSQKCNIQSDVKQRELMIICANNIHEVLMIDDDYIYEKLLEFLSAEYAGYFIYFSKTIEDRFMLDLNMTDSSIIELEGRGINNFGKFKVEGNMNLYRNKADILRNNDLNSDYIVLGKLKLKRKYLVFDQNENDRVIKSFTHRKRKKDEVNDIIYGVSYNKPVTRTIRENNEYDKSSSSESQQFD